MASPVLDTPMDDSSHEDTGDYDSDDYDSDGSEEYDSDEYHSDDSNEHLSDDSDDIAFQKADGNPSPSQEETPPPEVSDELIAATEEVDALGCQATRELSHFPRQTRNKLTSQTRAIFQSYEQHGSQQRLTNALEKFLLAPDDNTLDYAPKSPPLLPKPEVTRNIDPESAPLIRETPFHAADLTFEISGDVTIPPYLLPSLDRIFGLYTLEARALLKHHCEKYGDEPIFRAGIRAYMQSHLEGILEATADNALSLTPENRTFLLSVYERQAVLNLVEKRLLAMSTRLGVEAIEMFWEDMDLKREAYKGMKRFVAARELEGLRAEKRDAEWKKQRDGMLAAGREFSMRPGVDFGLGGGVRS